MFENYSDQVRKALEKAKLRAGSRIRIEKGGEAFEGLLMPRSQLGDSNSIVVKLNSGYNVGIAYEKGLKIKALGARDGMKRESSLELGRGVVMKQKYDSSKPSVAIIATGGTIASRVDYKTGGVSPLESPEEILSNVPELKEIVNVTKVLNPFNKASEDMSPKDWQLIAEAVAKELKNNSGVIVTHGTDTLHYTAAALSFMLKDLGKPVVLVGSQRSTDRGSSDAWMNLLCAAQIAKSDIGEVGICMHGTTDDDFCYFIRGVSARKLHSSARDAFRALNEPPLAKVWPDGKIEKLNRTARQRSDKQLNLDKRFETKIALVKAFPGSDPEILEWHAKKGYRGIVIEGTGMGHVPTESEKSWIPAIEKLVKKGVAVVITTQTLFGRVHKSVYANLRKLYAAGAISGGDMLSEVAYVKLGHVLAQTSDLKRIKELMEKNLVGELSERSEIVEI